MAAIERKIYLAGLDRSFLYSFSNDFDEIINALHTKTGIKITGSNDSEWTLNERLAGETKSAMTKYKTVYAATVSIKDDIPHVVINRRMGDTYYRYSGRIINSEFFTDIEPVTQELTKEIFDSITVSDILYAEFTDPGAMGNSGGMMLYTITEQRLNCYETNIEINEDVCKKAWNIISEKEKARFRFYWGGGGGNYVFINRDISVLLIDECFVYMLNGKSYCIYSSVSGVFLGVKTAMRRMSECAKKQ